MNDDEWREYHGLTSGRWVSWTRHQDQYPEHVGRAEDRNVECLTCGWSTYVNDNGYMKTTEGSVSNLDSILKGLTSGSQSNTIEA